MYICFLFSHAATALEQLSKTANNLLDNNSLLGEYLSLLLHLSSLQGQMNPQTFQPATQNEIIAKKTTTKRQFVGAV